MAFYNPSISSGIIQVTHDEIDQYIALGTILKGIKQTIENHEANRSANRVE